MNETPLEPCACPSCTRRRRRAGLDFPPEPLAVWVTLTWPDGTRHWMLGQPEDVTGSINGSPADVAVMAIAGPN